MEQVLIREYAVKDFDSKEFFLEPYQHPVVSWFKYYQGLMGALLTVYLFWCALDAAYYYLTLKNIPYQKIMMHATLTTFISYLFLLGGYYLSFRYQFSPMKIMRRRYKKYGANR